MPLTSPELRRLLEGHRESADVVWLSEQCQIVIGLSGAQHDMQLKRSKISVAGYVFNRVVKNGRALEECADYLSDMLPVGYAVRLDVPPGMSVQYCVIDSETKEQLIDWKDLEHFDRYAVRLAKICERFEPRLTVADVDAIIAKFEDFV